MHTIGLVEDDPTSRELLTLSIGGCKNLKLVKTYATAIEALANLPKLKPDVVLMDIKLPGMSGIECLVALRSLDCGFPSRVVMLTDYDDSDTIFNALRAGADGYLLKRHASSTELDSAINGAVAGGVPLSPSVARKVLDYFQTVDPVRPPKGGAPSKLLHMLSARQRQVLELLSQGFLYKEIADKMSISMNGVGKHISLIYEKLHVRTRSEAILHYLDS